MLPRPVTDRHSLFPLRTRSATRRKIAAAAAALAVAGSLVTVLLASSMAPPSRYDRIADDEKSVVVIDSTTLTGMGPATRMGAGFLAAIGRRRAYIVTANHVASADASKIIVTLSNGDQLFGKVAGGEPGVDVSVVSIPAGPARDLPVLKLGDSDALMPGEPLTIIGHPFFAYYSVSRGSVSAIHREDPALGAMVQDYVQTDGAVNGGNSGGPVIDDATNRVIGIADYIMQPPNTYPDPGERGKYDGLTALVSSRIAAKVFADVMAWGTVTPGISHIVVADNVVHALADDPAVPRISRGAKVVSVQAGSAAAVSGIRPGDVILSVNGRKITDGNDFRVVEFLSHPGDSEELTLSRAGRALAFAFPMGGEMMPNPASFGGNPEAFAFRHR
ncbi:MAG TPA: trypsin-like peptidase domain-containing protein [Acetobacteraceae bacterium]|nr:trypsin-like peptidase domain-containing protein [Acetobacteraceae bacterium]